MYFGCALRSDKNIEDENKFKIFELIEFMKLFFETRDYGAGINMYIIGVIYMSPEFDGEKWTDKNIKYTKSKKALEYNIKLDYAYIENNAETGVAENLAYRLLGSLDIIDELNIKDFDTESFRHDLISFFEEQSIKYDNKPLPEPSTSSAGDIPKTNLFHDSDGLFQISLMIHGIRYLDETRVAEVFRLLWEANPSYLPKIIGVNTPIKSPYSVESAQKVWNGSINNIGSKRLMFEGPNCKGNIICKQEGWNHVGLTIDRDTVLTKDGIERFIKLSKNLFLLINGVYGFSCFVKDYLSNLLVLDFRVCLGGISWLTLFGAPYVDMFGKEVLKTAPCLAEEFAENNFVLLASELPVPIKPALIRKQTKIKKHLGMEAFCGKNPPRTMEALEQSRSGFRSPNFRLYDLS